MKRIMIYFLIIFIIVIIILNSYKSNKNILEDIMIFSLWENNGTPNITQIDLFTTVNNKLYKKIAPGCSGSFKLTFKRPENSSYQINIIEKTSKPENLIFSLDGNQYKTLEEMEELINQKFINTDQITINWEWEYYIDEEHDIQDTKEGQKAQRYVFEINAIVEEQERIAI